MNKAFLGIDTSNYRTSIAAVDAFGSVIFQKAVLLDVPKGKRGLRQSEAFFHHSNRLPGYIEDLFEVIDASNIAAIGVSERPRRVEGSYMPCFLAGTNAARELASALRVPRYGFSHQEGHAAAVLESDGRKAPQKSIFFHLSGGTTEALLCSPDKAGYSMEIIGGTRDISIGQLFDRFGVALGLPFPSGSYLDDTAYAFLSDLNFDVRRIEKTGVIPPLKLNDGFFNLSGAETRLMRYAENAEAGEPSAEAVIAELFAAVSSLLIRESVYLSERFSTDEIWLSGGVASSRTVRAIVGSSGCRSVYFGAPALSGDNSVGTALLTKRIYNETCNS